MNGQPINYETLSEAVNDLKKRGFDYDFDFKNECLYDTKTQKEFESSALKVVEFHRFEGASDPEDNAIVYAIKSTTGERGVIIDAYGAYADADKTKFLSEIEVETTT